MMEQQSSRVNSWLNSLKLTIQHVIALLTIISCVQKEAESQGGFNVVYSEPEFGDVRFDDVVYANDTLTVVGIYGDDSVQAFGIIVAQFDTLGQLLRSATIVDSTQTVHIVTIPESRMLQCNDNGYAVGAYAFGRSNPILLKLNHALEVELLKEYEHSDKMMVPYNVIELNNGYMMFGRIQRENFNTMVYALRVDQHGNEIWRKFYGEPTFNSFFGEALVTNQDKVIMGSSFALPTNHNTPPDEEWSQPWIFSIDTNGVKQWEWIGDKRDGLGWTARNLLQTEDGGWVYTSDRRELYEVYPTVFESRYFPMLIKLDNNFEDVWLRDYSAGPYTDWTYFSDIATSSSDLIMVGQRGAYFPDIGAIAGRVVKADFEGHQTWEVVDTGLFGPTGSRNYLTGLALSTSGSIYCSGYADPLDDKTVGWLIKVTADGCIDTLCKTTSLVEQLEPIPAPATIHVWPNPARDNFFLKVPGEPGTRYDLSIYNMVGQYILTRQITGGPDNTRVDLKEVPPGTYFFSLREHGSGYVVGNGKVVVVR